jgi:hypothetical protein
VEGVVFRVAHHRSDATLWWHLDETYIGETRFLHELRLAPSPGKHTLTVVDDEGNSVSVRFRVTDLCLTLKKVDTTVNKNGTTNRDYSNRETLFESKRQGSGD